VNIISKNYAGVICALVDITTRKPVQLGDVRHTGNGKRVTVMGGSAPHDFNSSGRVYVQAMTGDNEPDGNQREYYPNVVDAKWIDAKEVQS
jgi:hypothetical protein